MWQNLGSLTTLNKYWGKHTKRTTGHDLNLQSAAEAFLYVMFLHMKTIKYIYSQVVFLFDSQEQIQ